MGAVLACGTCHGSRPSPGRVDLGAILPSELTVVWSMGCPSEIFDVTDDIIDDWQRHQKIISHRIPFDAALDALELAATPGAADGVVAVG